MLELLQREDVQKIVAHQCQLAQHNDEADPPKKPTGFMSNATEVLTFLNRRFFGKHGLCSRPQGRGHSECLGKTAQRAAIFQDQLRVTILRGFRAAARRQADEERRAQHRREPRGRHVGWVGRD